MLASSSAVNDLITELRSSGGSRSRLPELLELTCLNCMCTTANYTSHSAIVGSKVSSIAPNLEALPGVQDLKEIGSVALSRIDLFRYLIERTTLLLTQFSEILPTMSVSTATATLSLSSEVWAAAMSLSLHPTEDNVELLRSLESQIPGLLANPTCTAEERESLEVTSQMMQQYERTVCIDEGFTSRFPPQIFPQAPELPHLYHFTSNDVDCIFANQFPTKSSAPDRAAFFALLQRWSRSMNDWVGTLAIRTEHYAAQKYPFVIADRCWEACQSFFGYCDGELAKIVNHTHWRNYLELERVGNVIHMITGFELGAIDMLYQSQKSLDPSPYVTRGLVILSRLAVRSEMLRMAQKLPLRNRLNGLSMIATAVISVDVPTVELWCESFLDHAKQLLRGVQLAGFSYLSGAAASVKLASAIQEAESSLISRQAHWMVQGALKSMRDTESDSSSLVRTSQKEVEGDTPKSGTISRGIVLATLVQIGEEVILETAPEALQ